MPSEMVKAVRLYHTPDQMKQALKNSWVLQSADDSPHSTIEVSEEPDIITDSQLARRRSAVAKAILDEAASNRMFKINIVISKDYACLTSHFSIMCACMSLYGVHLDEFYFHPMRSNWNELCGMAAES